MIPKLIHRIWLDDPMPDQCAEHGAQWAALHPDRELVDWRDSASLPPLRNRDLFDRAEEFYPDDWKRFQSDLLRLELLWRFGGWYVDADTVPHRDVSPLLVGEFVVGRSPQRWRGRHPITNAVMGSVPEHPFVGACLDAIPEAVEQYRGQPLARSVGPWLLTRVLDSADWPTVTVLEFDDLYKGGWLTHQWNTAKRRRGVGF